MTASTDEDRIFQQLVATFDTPAFMRRAKNVEAAWEHLLEHCRRQREEWLRMPKLRLATLFALASDVKRLQRFLKPSGVDALISLRDEWQPRLRIAITPAHSPKQIHRSLNVLRESFARFNARWECFLGELDLTEINRLRDGYNRYYVLEKECAVRSATVARAGFKPLPLVTSDDVRHVFPLLPELHVRPLPARRGQG